MATVRKRVGVSGKVSYTIRVFCGLNSRAQRIDKSMTWSPPEGMTPKQIEKELERQKVLFEQEVKYGIYHDGNITFSSFADKWMEEYAKPKLAPKTVARYENFLKRINKAIGHKKLKDIKPLHLNAFYRNLGEEGVKQDCKGRSIKGATLSPKTIVEHHRLISTILSYAVKWQLLEMNVAQRADPPAVPHTEISILDEQEIKHLLALLEEEPMQYKVMIKLLIYTGMRRGELCGLEWKDIDFETGLLRIVRSSQYIGNRKIITKEPKTKAGRREMILSKSAIDMLREYRKWQNQKRLQVGEDWIDNDRLFTQWNGVPIYPDTISDRFANFIKKHDLPKVTLHSLRHSNATLLIAEGVDVKTVSQRLGHADVSTTLNIYTHALQSRDKEAAERLEQALSI